MIDENKELYIDYILENFDFDRVKKVMDFLDWKWGENKTSHVPTVTELILEARKLLIYAHNNVDTGHNISCGGFKASRLEDGLTLEFILEEDLGLSFGDFLDEVENDN